MQYNDTLYLKIKPILFQLINENFIRDEDHAVKKD